MVNYSSKNRKGAKKQSFKKRKYKIMKGGHDPATVPGNTTTVDTAAADPDPAPGNTTTPAPDPAPGNTTTPAPTDAPTANTDTPSVKTAAPSVKTATDADTIIDTLIQKFIDEINNIQKMDTNENKKKAILNILKTVIKKKD